MNNKYTSSLYKKLPLHEIEKITSVEEASISQKNIWPSMKRNTPHPDCNKQLNICVDGIVDIAFLELALTKIINKYKIFHTTFIETDDGKIIKITRPLVSFSIPLVFPVYSDADYSRPEPITDLIAMEHLKQEYNLMTGPLIRACLIQLPKRKQLFILSYHQIIMPPFYLAILIKDINALFSSKNLGIYASLSKHIFHRSDYDYPEQQWEKFEINPAQTYRQDDVLNKLPLIRNSPFFTSTSCNRGYHRQHEAIEMSNSETALLTSYANKQMVNVYSLLLSIYSALLFHYWNISDIIIFAFTPPRPGDDPKKFSGCFTENRIIHSYLSADQKFSELLLEVAATVKKTSFTVTDPYSWLSSRADSNFMRDIFFKPAFNFMDLTIFGTEFAERKITRLSFQSEPSSEYDLILCIENEKNILRMHFEYNAGLFVPETISQLLKHYKQLIIAVTTDPTQTLSSLPLLTEANRKQLLNHWNKTSTTNTPAVCIHELFETQAEKYPDRIAVIFEDKQLNYHELNKRANQLAHCLSASGVKPDSLVALYTERSLEMIIGLLGIIKAGGAYVPLDPGYPEARLRFILDDCGASTIVTEKHFLKKLSAKDKQIFCLDDPLTLNLYSEINLNTDLLSLTEKHLAYVIYTSGSTGKPKGVLVEHRNITRLYSSTQEKFQFTRDDIWILFHSFAFDVSVWEIWGAFLYGAKLVITPKTVSQSPVDSYQLLIQERVTILTQTPSVFELLIDTDQQRRDNLTLRTIVFCGEALNPEILHSWLINHDSQSIQLVNMYGITETTVHATYYAICCTSNNLSSRSIIGEQLSDLTLYLLDDNLSLVPPCVTGEIYIGGPGVTRGYLNNPELTCQRFIPDPFSSNPAQRLYKSGDLARRLPDGNLEFISRKDSQVKIRGFRIEPGEIEAVLAKHPSLRTSVVSLHIHNNSKHLIAYVCPTSDYLDQSGKGLTSDDLEQWSALYDQQYTDPENTHETASNFIGWNSSYTGKAIDDEQMHEWVNGTIRLIDNLEPKRVLEIGCGTGLLLYRYAAGCKMVYATDISAAALSGIKQEITKRNWSHVQLTQGDALSLHPLSGKNFDTVIINSVTQCFPNCSYLKEVIEHLLTCVEPGGNILIGDVRNLDLLTAHIVAIERSRIKKSTPGTQFSKRVQRRIQQEKDLLISPGFFAKLSDDYPTIDYVDILVKRGLSDNEMLRYRYDVVIHTSKHPEKIINEKQNIDWFSFNREIKTISELRNFISINQTKTFGIYGVKNARISQDVQLAEKIKRTDISQWVHPDHISGCLDSKTMEDVTELELLLQYAENHGFYCGATWSQDKPDYLDIIFSREKNVSFQAHSAYSQHHKTNFPQLTTIARSLSKELTHYLKEHLPEYMIPGIYIVLENLPLTINGKVDKRALPTPDDTDIQRENYVAPRNSNEHALCQLWQDILGIKHPGINDNFFALGGHSLLATRLINLIRKQYSIEIPLRTLFDAPTIAGLSEAMQKHSTDTLLPPITHCNRDQSLPLSYAQQRLWFIDQFGNGSAEYNISASFQLTGELNLTAFKQALDTLLKRHEILRTYYSATQGSPEQIIKMDYRVPFKHHILSGSRETTIEQNIQQLIAKEATTTFNLSNDLMLRVHLLTLTIDRHLVLYTVHHIACDGWSLPILQHELTTLYTAFSQGLENPLTPLAIQYADYALWQRQWLQEDVLEKQIQYWKSQLSGIATVHHLPLDKPRPSRQTFPAQVYSCQIPEHTTLTINRLCERNNVTLFMFMQTAFAVLLSRFSDETDIVVGSPVAGRTHRDIEPLIGFFVNSLVIRTETSGNPAFSQLLESNKQIILEAYANQDIPFEILVEQVRPERHVNHNPVFQIIFSVQKSESHLLNSTKNQPEQYHINTRFDLEVHLHETDKCMTVQWIYNTSLFDKQTVSQWANSYIVLLSSVIDSLSCAIEDQQGIKALNLLTESQRHTLLYEWNSCHQAFTADKCLHELFEEKTEIMPDRIAIVFDNKSLSYLELNHQANRLAHYLLARGLKPDSLVALCAERSLEMIIGLLAILKAGGAYVPLDPNYPRARLEHILNDCAAKVIITQKNIINKIPVDNQHIVYLHDKGIQPGQDSYAHLNLQPDTLSLTPDHLAYVIYTSGSTGKPKGVLVEHKNITRLFFSTYDQFRFCHSDIWTMFHSFAFDVSVWEIWGALIYGGKLIIVPRTVTFSPSDFYQLLLQEKVTILSQTPTVFEKLIEVDQDEQKDLSLRTIVFAGEALNAWILQPWFDLHDEKSMQLVNMYGITETTIHSTAEPLSRINRSLTQKNLIGRKLTDSTLYLLDEELSLVPPGIIGEIHIGGPGVTRGYLNMPGLTQQRFIKNPFANDPTERLYKSGDLARWLPNGKLEFIGRMDDQVKIRGFRIELEEIETQLVQHPCVSSCVITAHQKNTGDKQLIAYIVANKKYELPPDQHYTCLLRAHAQLHLPDYMIPDAFIMLEAFPLTNNNKVDRSALPPPTSESYLTEEHIAARTMTEKNLVLIWATLLDFHPEQISIRASFFSLGGHSLLVIKLIDEIQQTFNIRISLQSIFVNPTIEALARILDTSVAAEEPIHKNLIRLKEGNLRPLFFVHEITGEPFPYLELTQSIAAGIPCYALQMDHQNMNPLSNLSIETLATNYIEVIHLTQSDGPYRIAGWSMGGLIAYEMAYQLIEEGERVEFLGLIDSAPIEATTSQSGYQAEIEALLTYLRIHNIYINKETSNKLNQFKTINAALSFCASANILPERITHEHLSQRVRTLHQLTGIAPFYTPKKISSAVHLYEATHTDSRQSSLKWGSLIHENWNNYELTADHWSIMQAPATIELGRLISEQLK